MLRNEPILSAKKMGGNGRSSPTPIVISQSSTTSLAKFLQPSPVGQEKNPEFYVADTSSEDSPTPTGVQGPLRDSPPSPTEEFCLSLHHARSSEDFLLEHKELFEKEEVKKLLFILKNKLKNAPYMNTFHEGEARSLYHVLIEDIQFLSMLKKSNQKEVEYVLLHYGNKLPASMRHIAVHMADKLHDEEKNTYQATHTAHLNLNSKKNKNIVKKGQFPKSTSSLQSQVMYLSDLSKHAIFLPICVGYKEALTSDAVAYDVDKYLELNAAKVQINLSKFDDLEQPYTLLQQSKTAEKHQAEWMDRWNTIWVEKVRINLSKLGDLEEPYALLQQSKPAETTQAEWMARWRPIWADYCEKNKDTPDHPTNKLKRVQIITDEQWAKTSEFERAAKVYYEQILPNIKYQDVALESVAAYLDKKCKASEEEATNSPVVLEAKHTSANNSPVLASSAPMVSSASSPDPLVLLLYQEAKNALRKGNEVELNENLDIAARYNERKANYVISGNPNRMSYSHNVGSRNHSPDKAVDTRQRPSSSKL